MPLPRKLNTIFSHFSLLKLFLGVMILTVLIVSVRLLLRVPTVMQAMIHEHNTPKDTTVYFIVPSLELQPKMLCNLSAIAACLV
jgi:competence protein ComGC